MMPRHVGIIMDGNGRWATQRGGSRSEGHLEGVKAAKRIVAAAVELKIPFLSYYVFSTENWKRTEEEVSYLMFLVRSFLRKEYDFYRQNGIRILHSGDISHLPADIIREIDDVTRDTAGFPGLSVNLCINYGGRDEIVRAVNRFLEAGGTAPSASGQPRDSGS
jgi:undecaprenyl diphosphate synthase